MYNSIKTTQISSDFHFFCLQKEAKQCCSVTNLGIVLSDGQNNEYSKALWHHSTVWHPSVYKRTSKVHKTQGSFSCVQLIALEHVTLRGQGQELTQMTSGQLLSEQVHMFTSTFKRRGHYKHLWSKLLISYHHKYHNAH